MAAGALLQVKNIAKSYEAVDDGQRVDVLSGISFDLNRGESLSIVGPSGSGKSTLLNIIGTLDQPTHGDVLLEGKNLAKLNEEETAVVRNREIGFIFQAHHLLPQCTVFENVLIPTLASDKSLRAPAADRGRRLLERVGLGQRMNHRPGQLSGGERQRVAVVRALINAPRLLLADEPTGALDHRSALQLGDLLVELNKEENITLIVVTHSSELAARMQRKLELLDGKLR